MGKKRTKKQQEEEEEAEIQKSVGYYLIDAQLLLNEYFRTSDIDPDTESDSMQFITNKKDETLFVFNEKLYPFIRFTGYRSKLVPSRYRLFEKCGGGGNHMIFVSLVDFSIHLVIEDGVTRICRPSSALLELSSLVQAMPLSIFERFMDYLCVDARPEAPAHTTLLKQSVTTLGIDAPLVFTSSTNDPRIVILTKYGELNKAGYYARWKFVRRTEPHMDVHFQFTEEQERALVARFTKLPNIKLPFMNIQ